MFTSFKQIWDGALARNAAALAGVVAELLAVLSVYGGLDAVKVSRAVHSSIIRVLRPAESALRRLILIAARDVIVSPDERAPTNARTGNRTSPRKPASRMSFQLFDPRKRFGAPRVIYTTLVPRISFVGPKAPLSPLSPLASLPHESRLVVEDADRQIGARRLCLRLKALASALDDIPRQAIRLARLRLKRETQQPPRFFSPLRPGKPPGHRSIAHHEIDDILAECHKFALGVLSEARLNTS